MKLLKKTLDFFLFSNIFVALCVVALCVSTAFQLDVKVVDSLPFVFCASYFSYNFHRIVKTNQVSIQTSWRNKNGNLVNWTTFLAFIFSVYFATALSAKMMILLIPAALLSLLYPFSIFSFKGHFTSLRDIPFLKLLIIAFVWALVTVIFISANEVFSFRTLFTLFIQRFFFVMAITIPFDIRDVKFDKKKIKTIPVVFGVDMAKKIAISFLIVFELLALFQFMVNDIDLAVFISLLLTSLFSGILIIFSNNDSSEYYYSLYVEGSSIIMCLLLFFIPLAFGIFVT